MSGRHRDTHLPAAAYGRHDHVLGLSPLGDKAFQPSQARCAFQRHPVIAGDDVAPAESRTSGRTVVTEVAAWLASNRPADGAPALIHNDFKFDNAIFDEGLTHVTGILDWEMATVGDPRMDLGTALGYWVDATDPQPLQMMRFGPTTLPGMMTRSEVAARYMEASGTDVGNVVFFYAFGLFKTAVVAQQIYYRYKQGLTKDPRFAPFIHAVRALCEQAAVSIARGTIGA